MVREQIEQILRDGVDTETNLLGFDPLARTDQS
jgi:hypothetical protein